MQLGLSYQQSQFFRWFLKEAGCKKLLKGCNEKKVRAEKKLAGSVNVVGKVVIFTKMTDPIRRKKYLIPSF